MRIHFKYLVYLIRHKYYVFMAGFSVGCSLWQIVVHDWSKFLPSEWIPYARYFYRGSLVQKCRRKAHPEEP